VTSIIRIKQDINIRKVTRCFPINRSAYSWPNFREAELLWNI